KPCKEDCDTKYITETLYVETPENVYTVYYDTPKILSLTPHIYEVRCEANCPNLTQKCEYEISIDERHNSMTTNFNDGHVWLWYKGLPSDDEGNLVVPETSKDKLKNYIVYFAIVR